MQEEFIQQYKYIEDLIQRCYPGSMISLEFSIEDLLQYFSEIARSHQIIIYYNIQVTQISYDKNYLFKLFIFYCLIPFTMLFLYTIKQS